MGRCEATITLPGMGHVAVSAGYYLMAKLGMYLQAELPARDLFDVEHVEFKGGIIGAGRLPRSRFFAWRDSAGRHDLLVFIGEGRPPLGKYVFCRGLIEYARGLGVERVFTFAAMATQMHPGHAAASSAQPPMRRPSRRKRSDTSQPNWTRLAQRTSGTLRNSLRGPRATARPLMN